MGELFSSGSFRIDQLDRGYVDSKEQVRCRFEAEWRTHHLFWRRDLVGRRTRFTVRITSSDREAPAVRQTFA